MLKRLLIYFKEMYPITSWIGNFLCGFMVLTVSWRLHGGSAPFAWNTLWVCAGLCFFSLLLRVMDEFKDYELDVRLFPQRPLPSGRVFKSDLKILGWVCVVLGLAVSAWDQDVFSYALGVLFYSYLMLIWFGMEKAIRASLPLALVTHHPIVLFHFMYLISAVMTTSYATPAAYYLMPICFMFTNWEISRKIRQPKDENDYVTYSRIWGPRLAASITLVLQSSVLATVLFILHEMECKTPWSVVYLVGQLGLMWPSLRYLLKLQAPKPLKDWAEAQILWNVVYLLVAGWWG
jgi:4-hydroxybenzoate polyprenyltransferase